MADPARKRRATYQDVLDAPENLVAEIVEEAAEYGAYDGPG